MNLSCIVGFVICSTGTTSTAMMMILPLLTHMKGIPLDMIQIDSPEGSGYYSKSALATVLNSIRSTIISRLLLLQYPNPEKQGDKLL